MTTPLSEPASKSCSVCHEVKAIADFPFDAGSLDGHGHKCKPCHARLNREYRATDKGRQARRESMRRWREANRQRNLAARSESSGAA